MKIPSLVTGAIAFLLASMSRPASAQITYLQLQSDGTHRLRQMNADGSGDLVIQVPFARMEYPTWSRDRAQLAVTATDPTKPLERTTNVFGINAGTGAITKLTRYFDIIDDVNNSLNYTFPVHKAFSPNRARLATFSIHQFGGGGLGLTTFPSLEIHSLTTAANTLLVGNESESGIFHGGEGVDWSPNQDVLVAPLQTTVPNLTSGGTTGATAIFFIEPSGDALLQNRTQRLTSPRADVHLGTGTEVPFFWAEHDYQPKFSPNGTRLAYVRSFQAQTLANQTSQEPAVQALRIINLNTGADTQVAQFPAGRYVSTVNWSPDGTQLAFDIALQATSPLGVVQQKGRPETNQIYVINVDGAGLRQLRGNGNGSPAFGPRIGSAPPARIRFEAESLAVQAKSGATHAVINDAQMSGNAGTLLSNATVGSSVTYAVPVPAAGTYNVKVRVKTGPRRGVFQLAINGGNQGQAQDEYSPNVQYQTRSLGTVTFASGGNKAFKFTVAGRNPNSAGVALVFDSIDLVRQ